MLQLLFIVIVIYIVYSQYTLIKAAKIQNEVFVNLTAAALSSSSWDEAITLFLDDLYAVGLYETSYENILKQLGRIYKVKIEFEDSSRYSSITQETKEALKDKIKEEFIKHEMWMIQSRN